MGDQCPHYHCKEELIYHPLVFKTKICESELDEKRHCKKFGQHCAKAHGDHDLRIPKRVINSGNTNEDVDTNNVDIQIPYLSKLIIQDNEENNGINISNDISNKSDEVNDKNEQPNANDLYIDSFPNKKIRADNMSKFERTFKQNENKIKNDTGNNKKCGADLYSK